MEKKKLTEKQIQKALGASYSIKLKSGKDHSPLGLIAMAHEVAQIQQRHQQMREALKKMGWRREDRKNEELWCPPWDGLGYAPMSKRLELAYKQAMKKLSLEQWKNVTNQNK